MNLLGRDKLGRFAKGFPQGKFEDNPGWKGDKVTKHSVHRWIDNNYGKPKKCEKCNTEQAKRYDWANKSGKYLRDIKDFVRLCRSCHVKMDKNYIKKHETVYKPTKPTVKKSCPKCKIEFLVKDKSRIYCSKDCWYGRNIL